MSSGTARATDSEGPQITKTSATLAPLDAPQMNVANDVANVRKAIAAAVLAGDDAEAARLMALLGKPRLRAVT